MSVASRHRWLALVAFAGLAIGCRNETDLERMSLEEARRVCGDSYRVIRLDPPGERIQDETPHRKKCEELECLKDTVVGLRSWRFRGKSCAEVGDELRRRPLVDAWGARVRVVCNEDFAQAISGGRDGIVGTCDDLSRRVGVRVRIMQ